jgi:hypothetical protein
VSGCAKHKWQPPVPLSTKFSKKRGIAVDHGTYLCTKLSATYLEEILPNGHTCLNSTPVGHVSPTSLVDLGLAEVHLRVLLQVRTRSVGTCASIPYQWAVSPTSLVNLGLAEVHLRVLLQVRTCSVGRIYALQKRA